MPALTQYAAHGGTAQVDALPLQQQFGEMSVVGAGVAIGGQLHHGSRGCLRGRRCAAFGPCSREPMRSGRPTLRYVARRRLV